MLHCIVHHCPLSRDHPTEYMDPDVQHLVSAFNAPALLLVSGLSNRRRVFQRRKDHDKIHTVRYREQAWHAIIPLMWIVSRSTDFGSNRGPPYATSLLRFTFKVLTPPLHVCVKCAIGSVKVAKRSSFTCCCYSRFFF